MPSQWEDLKSTPVDGGPRLLYQAVALDALHQLRRMRDVQTPEAQSIVTEVLEWVRDLDGDQLKKYGETYPITFRQACEYGFDDVDAEVMSKKICQQALTFGRAGSALRCHFVARLHTKGATA
jgi:hypothetical protein